MTCLVTRRLEESGDAAYDRILAIKHAMLADTLRGRGADGAVAAQRLETGWAAFDGLSAADWVEAGTPFFWFNLHRHYLEDGADQHRLAELGRHLLMTSFDAYFHRLPDDAEVELAPLPGATVVLPRLGIRWGPSDQPVGLRRRSAERLELKTEDRTVDLALDDPGPAAALPRLEIGGTDGGWLLMVSNPALVRPRDLDRLAPDSPRAADLAAAITRALGLIRRADPAVGARLATHMPWYLPLATPEGVPHNSFTASHLIGVMFLAETYGGIDLAEAMVHEFLHTELYRLMATRDVVEYREDELYYSPWRQDPRPLYGLFHALHVFSGVVEFYVGAEGLEEMRDRIDELRERRRQICFKIRLGLAQVRPEALADEGREILRDLEERQRRMEGELEMTGDGLPAEMVRHFDGWRQSHPELASTARRP